MSAFHDLLLNWKSMSVSYGGEVYALSDVKDDYITLSKAGIDGLIDYTHIPIHAISSVQLRNVSKGNELKSTPYLRLISHQ